MSNRRRRLLRKLAKLPVSKEERLKRERQRLIAETEQRMTVPLLVHDARENTFHSFASSMEGALRAPYNAPLKKEDLDNLVAAVSAAVRVPARYLWPQDRIQGVSADSTFTDDPLKKELEDDK
jgi:hypothetical protein